MNPGKYDFTIYQGSTFTKTIQVDDGTLDGIDLSGYEARLQIRDAQDKTSALVATLHSDLNQILSAKGAIGGTFTLAFGTQITAPIPYAATSLQIKNALEALSNIGIGNIVATGGPLPREDIFISFVGPFEHQRQPLLSPDDSGLYAAPIDINVLTPGVAGVNASQLLSIDAGVGGTFTLTFGDKTTSAIAYNASAATIQTRLQALSNIGVGGVSVTPSVSLTPTSPLTITFTNQLGFSLQEIITADYSSVLGGPVTISHLQNGAAPVDQQQTITVTGATGGTFTLRFGNHITDNIPYNVSASVLQTTIQQLANVGTGNATVTNPTTGVYVVTFVGALAHSPQPTFIPDPSGFTGASITITTTQGGGGGFDELQTIALNNATGGYFHLLYNGHSTHALPYNATNDQIYLELATLTGLIGNFPNGSANIAVDQGPLPTTPARVHFLNNLSNVNVSQLTANANALTKGNVSASVTRAAVVPMREIQKIIMGPTTGGTFTLTYSAQTTNPLPYTATHDDIQSELEVIMGVGNVDVAGGPINLSPIIVSFIGSLDNAPHTAITANSSLLIGGPVHTEGITAGVVPVNEIQQLREGNVTDGTFTLSYNNEATTALAYNASAVDVSTALKALVQIGNSDIIVTGGPFPTNPIVVQFTGVLAGGPRPLLTADSSNLLNETAIVVSPPNDGVILIDAPSSSLTLYMDADKTASFTTWGVQKYYDLKLTSPTGDVVRVLQGKVSLDNEVTGEEPFVGEEEMDVIVTPQLLPNPSVTQNKVKMSALRARFGAKDE